jgi:hypothetical protein
MIAQNPIFYVDTVTGQYYVMSGSLSLLGLKFLHIPTKIMEKVHAGLIRRRKNLYANLQQMDKNFYVWVETNPGGGFRRITPANPTYSFGVVREIRKRFLDEIESNMVDAVQLEYQLNPSDLEVSVFLRYPDLNGLFKQTLLKPFTGSSTNFKTLNCGQFFIVGEDEVAK